MDQEELDYETPYLRAKIGSYEREIANLKEDNASLTEALYKAYERIKELTEDNTKTISGDERTW